jgi:chromosome partitioning protein
VSGFVSRALGWPDKSTGEPRTTQGIGWPAPGPAAVRLVTPDPETDPETHRSTAPDLEDAPAPSAVERHEPTDSQEISSADTDDVGPAPVDLSESVPSDFHQTGADSLHEAGVVDLPEVGPAAEGEVTSGLESRQEDASSELRDGGSDLQEAVPSSSTAPPVAAFAGGALASGTIAVADRAAPSIDAHELSDDSADLIDSPSPLRAAASLGLGNAPLDAPLAPVSRETAAGVSPATEPTATEDEEFPESPRPVDDYPLETPPHAGIHPQRPVDEPGGKPAPTPTDILFGPSPAPIGMGAMTAAQIAARATSDELQRRLLETPIAAATERTLLVNEGRTMGREFPLPAETRVFVVANQKGGVGKTTTTVNVAAGLALYGARILVIDLDPQGNASTALGIEHSEGTPGIYEAVIEGEPLSKLLAPCAEHPGIMVVPATIDLAGAEIELVSIVARESRLKKALDAHLAETEAAGEKYDYVFIDCPPSLGLLTVNALTAAREVLVPIQSEYYALEGLSQLLRHIDMVKAHLNPTLDVSTILLTMYDARTKLAGEVAAEVRGHFKDSVLRTAVPRSVRISEAPSHGQTVLAYDPASAGALSYLEASREIAMRNNA